MGSEELYDHMKTLTHEKVIEKMTGVSARANHAHTSGLYRKNTDVNNAAIDPDFMTRTLTHIVLDDLRQLGIDLIINVSEVADSKAYITAACEIAQKLSEPWLVRFTRGLPDDEAEALISILDSEEMDDEIIIMFVEFLSPYISNPDYLILYEYVHRLFTGSDILRLHLKTVIERIEESRMEYGFDFEDSESVIDKNPQLSVDNLK